MKSLELVILIKDGKITPPDKLAIRQGFDNLIDGTYNLKLTKRFKKGSKDQFGWLFGAIFKEMQRAFLENGFEVENIDQVESICMQLFTGKEIVNRNTGESIKIPERKRDMNTIELMTFCESIRNYAAENLNYYIEDPVKDWKEFNKQNNENLKQKL